MNDLLTVKQVAELLQLSETTVRRYIKTGRLEAVRMGRNVRVPHRAVTALRESLSSSAFHEPRPVYHAVTRHETAVAPPLETPDDMEKFLYQIFQKIARGEVSLDDEGDELLKLAGTLSFEHSDIAESHDDYIGEGLRNDAT